jgi:hypothetical protein
LEGSTPKAVLLYHKNPGEKHTPTQPSFMQHTTQNFQHYSSIEFARLIRQPLIQVIAPSQHTLFEPQSTHIFTSSYSGSLMEGKKTVDVVTSQRVAGSLALLESGQSSDMVIQCGSDEYHVHRSIVCPRWGDLGATTLWLDWFSTPISIP